MIQGMAWLKELLFDTESANIEKLDKRLNTAFDPFQSLEGLNERERTKRRNEAAVALPKSSEMRSALRKWQCLLRTPPEDPVLLRPPVGLPRTSPSVRRNGRSSSGNSNRTVRKRPQRASAASGSDAA